MTEALFFVVRIWLKILFVFTPFLILSSIDLVRGEPPPTPNGQDNLAVEPFAMPIIGKMPDGVTF